jgi:hypothetical protein
MTATLLDKKQSARATTTVPTRQHLISCFRAFCSAISAIWQLRSPRARERVTTVMEIAHIQPTGQVNGLPYLSGLITEKQGHRIPTALAALN